DYGFVMEPPTSVATRNLALPPEPWPLWVLKLEKQSFSLPESKWPMRAQKGAAQLRSEHEKMLQKMLCDRGRDCERHCTLGTGGLQQAGRGRREHHSRGRIRITNGQGSGLRKFLAQRHGAGIGRREQSWRGAGQAGGVDYRGYAFDAGRIG